MDVGGEEDLALVVAMRRVVELHEEVTDVDEECALFVVRIGEAIDGRAAGCCHLGVDARAAEFDGVVSDFGVLILTRSGGVCGVGFVGLRLHEDVAVLGAAAGAGDVELREAIEVAGGAPSGVALVVAVVGAGLGHAEGERGSDEDVSALVSAEHGVDFGGSLCVEEGGGGDGKERCSVQK